MSVLFLTRNRQKLTTQKRVINQAWRCLIAGDLTIIFIDVSKCTFDTSARGLPEVGALKQLFRNELSDSVLFFHHVLHITPLILHSKHPCVVSALPRLGALCCARSRHIRHDAQFLKDALTFQNTTRGFHKKKQFYLKMLIVHSLRVEWRHNMCTSFCVLVSLAAF